MKHNISQSFLDEVVKSTKHYSYGDDEKIITYKIILNEALKEMDINKEDSDKLSKTAISFMSLISSFSSVFDFFVDIKDDGTGNNVFPEYKPFLGMKRYTSDVNSYFYSLQAYTEETFVLGKMDKEKEYFDSIFMKKISN